MAKAPVIVGAALDGGTAAYLSRMLGPHGTRFVNVSTSSAVARRTRDIDAQALLIAAADAEMGSAERVARLREELPEVRIVVLDAGSGPGAAGDAGGADGMVRVRDLRALPPEQAGRRLLELALPGPVSGEAAAEGCSGIAEIVGASRAMREVTDLIRRVAPRTTTVLIHGRTGTGKELVARALQGLSPRAAKPFVVVNCGAIPENLVESELFGHVRGAFTGAHDERKGSFEVADGGTLFLDEVGELPLDSQSKLLRTLQEREIQRVGSSRRIAVDVRVIAATNRDLAEMVRAGKFREDLYYRLNVVPIRLPALAKRSEDIPALVEHLVGKVCAKEKLPVKQVTAEVLVALSHRAWPGNIRQLENAVEQAIALSGERETLSVDDFREERGQLEAVAASALPEVRLPPVGIDYDAAMSRLERSILTQALELARGNKRHAADLLRLKRTTFSAKLKAALADSPLSRAGAEGDAC